MLETLDCEVGDVVRVVWLDHCESSGWHYGDEAPTLACFVTWGMVTSIDEDSIVIASQVELKDDHESIDAEGARGDEIALVRGAILNLTKIG